jgi:hypothetical protein
MGYLRQNPALAGDLLEEFQSGRSSAWYWRQALMVIVTAPGRKSAVSRLYVKAMFGGFAAQFPFTYMLWRLDLLPKVQGFGQWSLAVLAAIAMIASLSFLEDVIAARSVRGLTIRDARHLKRLVWTTRGSPQHRFALTVVRSVKAFADFIWIYCVYTVVFPSSLPFLHDFVLGQGVWLVIEMMGLFTIELTPARQLRD